MTPIRFAVSLLVFSSAAFAATDTSLQSKIEAMAAQHHGKLALYVSNLKTGDTIAINPDTPVTTASVIKLPILVEAMEQVKAGKHKLDDKITLQKDDIVQGSASCNSSIRRWPSPSKTPSPS